MKRAIFGLLLTTLIMACVLGSNETFAALKSRGAEIALEEADYCCRAIWTVYLYPEGQWMCVSGGAFDCFPCC